MLHISLAAYADRLKERFGSATLAMSNEEAEINEAKRELAEEIADELKSLIEDSSEDARFSSGR